MLFQVLDKKKNCLAIYENQNTSIIYNHLPENLTKTWKYYSPLKNEKIEYAQIYCQGKTLDEVCPEELKLEWNHISNRMKAFFTSFEEAKISMKDICFSGLIPENFLLKYCHIKSRICEHVFKNYPKPENYKFLEDLIKLLHDIKCRSIVIDDQFLKNNSFRPRARQLYRMCKSKELKIDFNPFKTATGRLATCKGSFPIMTINRDLRKALRSKNDFFIELDYNAAELRSVIALSGETQPSQDLHTWNAKNIYGGKVSRKEAKEKIFAWLYNPNAFHHTASKFYNRESIKEKYWSASESTVSTFFGREIKTDEYRALNYIIQSTTSDMVLRQIIKIHKMLENKKSYISFCLHDSVIIDYSQEDKDLLKDIIETFSETELGQFPINISGGKNFGEMRRLRI